MCSSSLICIPQWLLNIRWLHSKASKLQISMPESNQGEPGPWRTRSLFFYTSDSISKQFSDVYWLLISEDDCPTLLSQDRESKLVTLQCHRILDRSIDLSLQKIFPVQKGRKFINKSLAPGNLMIRGLDSLVIIYFIIYLFI